MAVSEANTQVILQKHLDMIVQTAMYHVKFHPSRFTLVFDPKFNSKKEIFDPCDIDDDEVNTLIKTTWDDVVFHHKRAVFTAADGQYGFIPGRFTGEDFTFEIECKDGVTIRNIMEGVYRLKYDKNDCHNTYEIFTRINILDQSGETIKFEVCFQYGE